MQPPQTTCQFDTSLIVSSLSRVPSHSPHPPPDRTSAMPGLLAGASGRRRCFVRRVRRCVSGATSISRDLLLRPCGRGASPRERESLGDDGDVGGLDVSLLLLEAGGVEDLGGDDVRVAVGRRAALVAWMSASCSWRQVVWKILEVTMY